MTDVILAQDERPGRRMLEALLGGAVALTALTMAQAALPDRISFTTQTPAVRASAQPAPRAATQPPPVLIAFTEPVPGRPVVSPFGLRQMPWEESGRLHAGVDISADPGEPVLASADGVVVEAGHSSTYGRYVAVRHAEGLTSFYAHMGGIEPGLRPGHAVRGGQPVGRIGSTGTSTGPHLHFEIRDKRDRPLNPNLFLGRAFADADDLPLRQARRFGGHVRLAHVSMIPKNKRAAMEAKLAKEALEKEQALAERELRLAMRAAPDAASAGVPAAATEKIDGLQDVGVGEDGRPRARLNL